MQLKSWEAKPSFEFLGVQQSDAIAMCLEKLQGPLATANGVQVLVQTP